MNDIRATEPDCSACGTRCYPGPAGQPECRRCGVVMILSASCGTATAGEWPVGASEL